MNERKKQDVELPCSVCGRSMKLDNGITATGLWLSFEAGEGEGSLGEFMNAFYRRYPELKKLDPNGEGLDVLICYLCYIRSMGVNV